MLLTCCLIAVLSTLPAASEPNTLSDEERRRRLVKRGETSAKRFEENLDEWQAQVRQSEAPFITIDASGSPEAIVEQVIERFGFGINA